MGKDDKKLKCSKVKCVNVARLQFVLAARKSVCTRFGEVPGVALPPVILATDRFDLVLTHVLHCPFDARSTTLAAPLESACPQIKVKRGAGEIFLSKPYRDSKS